MWHIKQKATNEQTTQTRSQTHTTARWPPGWKGERGGGVGEECQIRGNGRKLDLGW